MCVCVCHSATDTNLSMDAIIGQYHKLCRPQNINMVETMFMLHHNSHNSVLENNFD